MSHRGTGRGEERESREGCETTSKKPFNQPTRPKSDLLLLQHGDFLGLLAWLSSSGYATENPGEMAELKLVGFGDLFQLQKIPGNLLAFPVAFLSCEKVLLRTELSKHHRVLSAGAAT